MSLKDEIRESIALAKRESDLFFLKSDYLRSNEDLQYVDCSLASFMEAIFTRDNDRSIDLKDGFDFPFEESQCPEYVKWRRQFDGLEEGGVHYDNGQDFRYNAIWMVLRHVGETDGKNVLKGYPYVITSDLKKAYEILEETADAVISSPITYVGRNRTSNNARYFYAFAFDLDGVGLNQISELLYEMRKRFIPAANIIVNSGNGLHLYYILKKPIPLFPNVKNVLGRMKKWLTEQIWNQYTSSIKKRQFQGIFQGFRVPGSRTKRGEEVVAFINRDIPLWTITDLCYWIPKRIVTEDERIRLDEGKYASNRMSLKKAKEKYPEWYERVIVNGDKSKGKWKVSRRLYDWWLARLRDPEENISEGHRYFCLLVLAIYAKKCGVSEEELKEDAYSLVDSLEERVKNKDNRFTEDDAEDALKAYKDDYCTFPKESIELITGLRMPTRRRNGRKQDLHLKLARANRDVLQEEKGTKWDAGKGRPKATPYNSEYYKKVQQWRKDNPFGTKSECKEQLGLSYPTIRKWWGDGATAEELKVQEWRQKNPTSANKSLCARETGLSRPTVRKWWKSR